MLICHNDLSLAQALHRFSKIGLDSNDIVMLSLNKQFIPYHLNATFRIDELLQKRLTLLNEVYQLA